MTSIQQPSILRRSDRVDETRIGDRLVLYHRDTGAGIVLNPAGSFIWETLAKPHSANDIVAAFAARHAGVDLERIRHDVVTYVDSLREQSLLDEAGLPSGGA